MAENEIEPLARLQACFRELPGIGQRSAERLAFHVLCESRASAAALAQSILDVKDKIIHCRICSNLTEQDPCVVCSDANRNQGEIWVVEQPRDLLALEATGLVKGTYHVLMGHIAPLDGVEPEHLTIDRLIARIRAGGITEVVLALNPTVDGDAT